jgi:hypothetical protein
MTSVRNPFFGGRSTAVRHESAEPGVTQRARQLLEDYLRETSEPAERDWTRPITVQSIFGADPRQFPTGRTILASDPAVQVALVRVALDRSLASIERSFFATMVSDIWRLNDLTGQLHRRRLPYTADDVVGLCRRMGQSNVTWDELHRSGLSLRGPLRSVERWTSEHELPDDARDALQQLRGRLSDAEAHSDGRALLTLLDQLLGSQTQAEDLIDPSDDWGHFASSALRDMPPADRREWLEMLRLATTLSGSKPSRKWQVEARERIERYGSERYSSTVTSWLRLLDRPTRNSAYRKPDGFSYPSAFIADRNAEVLKGLAWCCAVTEDERLARALGDAAEACFRKIPQLGARSTRAGNACVGALGSMPGLAAVAQLQRLQARVKQPSALKQILSALTAAAARAGMTRDDLEDLAVPTFGLVDGCARTMAGDCAAEITFGPNGEVDVRWRRADGRLQASVPADVKRDFPDVVKDVQQQVKDLRLALGAQRMRLERLLLSDRAWKPADWRERFIDQPLMANLARRLIWQFRRGEQLSAGAWLDGWIVDASDDVLDWLDDATEVRLWHPIAAAPEDVLAWRDWLERQMVTQPFKQAHREVYLLTDAERATSTYSNRFAAHILRQHQFRALCRERGWAYTLQGEWDGHNVPTLDLPQASLRAEYWVDIIEADDAPVSAHFVHLYVTTDQVRFYRAGEPHPVALEQVPPLVFSEVMRDVDLFVGVCSVGSDPTWFDGGPELPGMPAGYWWEVSFGELSASAATRAVVLERLLPRLTIADRCRLDGRFVVVRGDLRTYRIHLGSGNILMEPNDQFLCIVPGRGAGTVGSGQLYLPFAGDTILSVILSKAFLLADDRKITDPTIVRQIVVT